MVNDVSKAIARRAAKDPERPAVIDGFGTLSYGALHERANRWATALRAFGVSAGDRIMMMLPNRAAFIEILVAAIRSDVVPVLLNSHFTREDVAVSAAAANADLLLTTRALVAGIDDGRQFEYRVLCLEDVELSSYVASPASETTSSRYGADIIFYSSGTTGKPKGVVVPKFVFDLALPRTDFRLEPRLHLLCRPLFFRAHLTAACSILQEGNTIVLCGTNDPAAWTELVERLRIAFVSLGPADLAGWMEELERRGSRLPQSVRHLMTTGAPLPPSLKLRIQEQFPGLRVTDVYGSSEAGAIAMIDNGEWTDRPGSCGRPAFFAAVKILDNDKHELPVGSFGEVWVKTRYRMRAYLGDPAATSEVFDGEYVKTGDVGFVDELGYLHLTGRSHEVINRGGYYIFPEEVENVLREARGVADAVVIGMETPGRTQEPVAFIRLQKQSDEPSDAAAERELLAHCRRRLAEYKVPASVLFVNDIPRNAAGKADRSNLARTIELP